MNIDYDKEILSNNSIFPKLTLLFILVKTNFRKTNNQIFPNTAKSIFSKQSMLILISLFVQTLNLASLGNLKVSHNHLSHRLRNKVLEILDQNLSVKFVASLITLLSIVLILCVFMIFFSINV